MLRLCLLLTLVLVSAPAAAAEQPPKPPPWHLVDIWWNTGENRTFESYSIDVTISDDVSSGAEDRHVRHLVNLRQAWSRAPASSDTTGR